MADTNLLSIVIPCYNEAGNIPLIIGRLTDIVGKRKDIEVILVNNGSTDNSSKIFETELNACKLDCFRIADIKKNQGYGYGILQGLKEAKGDVIAWTHADMQTDPNDVLIAFDRYKEITENTNNNEENKIFIKGKRKNRKALDAFFTWGMQMVAWFALKTYLDDINAQPKMFSREFYETYVADDAPHDFSLDLYVLYKAKKNGYKTIEIPVDFAKRIHGEAKGGGGSWKNRIKLIKRTFAYIFELKQKI